LVCASVSLARLTLFVGVSTRQQAIDLNVGTKIDLYNAKEALEKSQAALASDQGPGGFSTVRAP
jgi:hypothetical protein